MPQGDYASTTANGFMNPSANLVIHSMCALFISITVVVVVYFMREHLSANARGDPSRDATPPVHAYTVEIQGMRVDPLVSEEELRRLLDLRLEGKYIDVQIIEDVTVSASTLKLVFEYTWEGRMLWML